MFLRWDLEDIWKNGNHSRSGIKKDGKLISGASNEVSEVLSFEESFSKSGIALVKAGYRVDRVAPWKANAVIRVYREEEFKHDDCIHWIYGADIYLKNFGVYFNSERVMIDHRVYKVRWMFWPDDMPISTPDFVDYYVRIRKV